MSRVENYPDGSSIQIDYEDVPLPANDPYVRSRERAIEGASSSEFITEFAAAPSQPSTYPIGLPFLADRDVWTTESPDSSVSPGALWRCEDPDAVIAAVIEVSRADGWSVVSRSPIPSTIVPSPVAVLSRLGTTRALMKFEADDVRFVQLLEFVGERPEPYL
jgi:hypothetical protein